MFSGVVEFFIGMLVLLAFIGKGKIFMLIIGFEVKFIKKVDICIIFICNVGVEIYVVVD